MKYFKYIFLLFLAISAHSVLGQSFTVTGVVSDDTGEVLPGASIVVRGANIGTTTNANGSFTLNNVPPNSVLQVSFVGFANQTITVGDQRHFEITLGVGSAIEEVVITAEFGIQRVARSIGSSVQNVRAADIADSGREDFISALQGRVSGLNVVSSGGAPGSSTTVTLRSMTSLTGDNQPLYVIDGVPMNNSSFNPVTQFARPGGGGETYASRGLDFASRGNDLNPDDIESVTVLKGAAAAALYGSNASNGAIIITTRKGQAGAGRIIYSNHFRWDHAYGIPERQTKYAHGAYGVTNQFNASAFGGLYPEGTKFYNNMQAILQTGFSQRHNLSVEGGTERITVRAAASWIDQTGVVRNTDYSRRNISLSGTGQITNWLRFESTMQYAGTTNTKQMRGGLSPLFRASRWPITDDMRNYMAENGTNMRYPDLYIDGDLLNPLFMMNKNRYYDISDRLLGSATAIIRPIHNVFLRAQFGWDVGMQTNEASEHPYWAANNHTIAAGRGGTYNLAKPNFYDNNINIIAGWEDSFADDLIDISVQFGYHQTENKYNNIATYGQHYAVLDLISINNTEPATIVSSKRVTNRRLQALSGQVMFGYNNMAFLTLRARNDWSSTLPVANNRYFYPAAEFSFVMTELPFLKNIPVVEYFKLRSAIAQVGKDARPLSINPDLVVTGRTGGGYRYDFTGPNLKLRPEMTTSTEAGFDVRLFGGRVNADFTHFNTRCADQIVHEFRMSYASGFILNTRNVGEFKTWGWESHINGDIVRTRDWLFNLGFNLSSTKSRVTEFPVEMYYDAYTWNSGNIRNGTTVGSPITIITGQDYMYNEAGQVLIDQTTGTPIVSTDHPVLGDREPKIRYGMSARVRYKSWGFSALAAGKLGATVVNGTMRQMFQQGTSWESVRAREAGPIMFTGVLRDGNEDTANPTYSNITLTSGLTGTTLYAGIDKHWIEKNINYLRLQEIRVSYTVPQSILRNFANGFISNASVFATGNDLFTLTNYTGVDAVGNTVAASAGGVGGEGYDMWALPNPRGFAVGLSVTF